MRRKYVYFILASDDADEQVFDSYSESLKEYHKHRSATLYGFNEYSEGMVIFSK